MVEYSNQAICERKEIVMEEHTNQKNSDEILPKEDMTPKEYEEYVKQVTPTHKMSVNILWAFVVGGLICCLGQFLNQTYQSMGASEEAAGTWTSITLILISVVLTCLDIFSSLTKFAGAGILVPITGFANGVASTAVEYQKEGQVFGIGCKIFTIAGPVILYGVFTSWILGLIYWIVTYV
jgi:stage V sporulation protein AC